MIEEYFPVESSKFVEREYCKRRLPLSSSVLLVLIGTAILILSIFGLQDEVARVLFSKHSFFELGRNVRHVIVGLKHVNFP